MKKHGPKGGWEALRIHIYFSCFCRGLIVMDHREVLRRYPSFFAVKGYLNELISQPFFNRMIRKEGDRWQSSKMVTE
jgi:hypothetical protein